MRSISPERRGGVAALVVAVTIAILLVVLQPGPKPQRAVTEETVGTTTSSTASLSPGVQLCNLAKRFVQDAEGLEPYDVARIAEVFYVAAVKLVDGATRAEFDATARYYTEFNQIGSEFDYDVFRIAAAGRGDRWAQLLYRPPLGIETARAAIQFTCEVTIPPPPTLTTLPPTTTTTAFSGPGGSGATGTGATGSPWPPTRPSTMRCATSASPPNDSAPATSGASRRSSAASAPTTARCGSARSA